MYKIIVPQAIVCKTLFCDTVKLLIQLESRVDLFQLDDHSENVKEETIEVRIS